MKLDKELTHPRVKRILSFNLHVYYKHLSEYNIPKDFDDIEDMNDQQQTVLALEQQFQRQELCPWRSNHGMLEKIAVHDRLSQEITYTLHRFIGKHIRPRR